MAKCYQLVGVPCAGKSTWIKNQDWAKDCVVVSTDNHVEDYAKRMGKTYNEVFKEYMPVALEFMVQDVIKAREAGKDIIWDQTSTTVKSRRRKFNMLRDYEHIAVVFATPDLKELKRRLASRPGKNIPSAVMVQMINGFQKPSKDEGFTDIWSVS